MHTTTRILALAAMVSALAGAACAQDAAKGKSLFYNNTCYGCHGFNGQTGARNLVGTPSPILASPESFVAFLRGRSANQPMIPSHQHAELPGQRHRRRPGARHLRLHQDLQAGLARGEGHPGVRRDPGFGRGDLQAGEVSRL